MKPRISGREYVFRHARKGFNADLCTAKLILTPLTMVSFILSLFIVDHQQRAWRISQHQSDSSSSLWYKISHLSWLDPEPYQDSRDSTWKTQSAGQSNQHAPPSNDKQSWYGRKFHRTMAKLEIGDAFEMKERIMLAVVFWALFAMMVFAWCIRLLYGWLFHD